MAEPALLNMSADNITVVLDGVMRPPVKAVAMPVLYSDVRDAAVRVWNKEGSKSYFIYNLQLAHIPDTGAVLMIGNSSPAEIEYDDDDEDDDDD
jgi:hypothetical protein